MNRDPAALGFGARFVTAVSTGSILNPINSSIIAVALVSIGTAFGVGAETTAWLVSALYLATAVGQPTMGKLADRFGARRVYLTGLALVGAGGLLGYVGPTLSWLVVARVVIGLGTSAAYPAAMALVRRQSERLGTSAPGSVLGALAIAGQVSMAVGPPLGGLLIAAGGWRAIFLVNLPMAVVGAVFALCWLPSDDRTVTRHRASELFRALDVPGLALFATGLTCLMLFLMKLATPSWPLLILGVLAVGVLLWWEHRAHTPFLDTRMLAANRPLTATYLRYAATFLVNYCFVYGWTQWLEQSTGRSSSATGVLLVPGFVVAAVASAIGARGRRVLGPLLVGTAALVAGSASLLFLHASTPTWALVVVSVLFGIPTGLNTVGNQAAMYAQAPAEEIGTAAGLMRTFMYIGAVLSAGLIGVTYRDRATDAGLHLLGTIMTAVSVLLLAATVLGRSHRLARPHPHLVAHSDRQQ